MPVSMVLTISSTDFKLKGDMLSDLTRSLWSATAAIKALNHQDETFFPEPLSKRALGEHFRYIARMGSGRLTSIVAHSKSVGRSCGSESRHEKRLLGNIDVRG